MKLKRKYTIHFPQKGAAKRHTKSGRNPSNGGRGKHRDRAGYRRMPWEFKDRSNPAHPDYRKK